MAETKDSIPDRLTFEEFYARYLSPLAAGMRASAMEELKLTATQRAILDECAEGLSSLSDFVDGELSMHRFIQTMNEKFRRIEKLAISTKDNSARQGGE